VPFTARAIGRLYHPFWSGGRTGAAVTDGGVWSYFSENDPDPEFPALSVQLPETLALSASGPSYVADVQLSTPDVASEPAKETATEWLYHPFASGPRAGLGLTLGAVASYLSANDPEAVFPALSVHVPPTFALSLSGPL
jgi:hypothetical protein